MQDNYFAAIASDYAKFRPRYPAELFRELAELAPHREFAWDCATGSGQAAHALAEHFARVVATDISDEMLAHAPRHERIEFRRAEATASGLAERSIALVTVANAMHWFHGDVFEREVRRVLAPSGLIAAWCYSHAHVTAPIDELTRHLHDVVVDPFWIEPNRLVERGYRDLPFPFERVATPTYRGAAKLDLARFVGYLSTWSASVKYARQHGRDPLDEIRVELEREWGDPKLEREVTWPLHLVVGRVR